MGKYDALLAETGVDIQFGLGNIDLNDRPVIKNSDGTISTVRSMSFGDNDGKEVLIPTVRKGLDRIMSDQEAIDWYRKTGEYLGKFNSVDEADKYAEQLHENQGKQYSKYGDLLAEAGGDVSLKPMIDQSQNQPLSTEDKNQSGGYLQNIGEYWTKDLPEAGKNLVDRTVDRAKRIEAPTTLGGMAKDATGTSGVVGDLIEGTAGVPERLTRLFGGAIGTIGDAAGSTVNLGAKALNNVAGGLPGKALKPVGEKIDEVVKPTAEKINQWYESLPEADKANVGTAVDLLDALFYGSPKAASSVIDAAGKLSKDAGKKVMQSTLKIKDKTAKLAGKNINEGVQKIVDDVVKFDLQSTTGGIKSIESKAQDAIDSRMFNNDKVISNYAKENPTAGVNVTILLDDLAKDIKDGKIKQIFTGEDDAAAFVSEINKSLEKRNLHGYRTVDKLPEIKKVIKEGLDAFSDGKFAIGDATRKELIGDLSYLKLTDEIGKHIPEYNAANKEIHDLINVKTAMQEAQKRIGNKNNIGLTDWLALLGVGPGLASMGVPTQLSTIAPLVAGTVITKKALSNGRGASGLIDIGNVADKTSKAVKKTSTLSGTTLLSAKKDVENKKKPRTTIKDMSED